MGKVKVRLTVGCVYKKHGGWHWKYYGADGKQTSKKLADVCDQYRTKSDVIPLANEMATRIRPTNGNQPRSGSVTIVDFAESVFLPWVQEARRPATYNGYRKLWATHLKNHFADRRLFEYAPHDATELLTALAKQGMGRHAVSHVRALMSGVFAHAVARGYLNVNPIHDCKLLVEPRAPQETPHYTVQEMGAIIAALQGQPQALVAMALAFIGLRPSEIRGLRWNDVDIPAGIVHIRRSGWRYTVAEGGKGKRSVRDVTFGPTIAAILEDFQESHPSTSGLVLENSAGNSLDLWALAHRSIRPTLAKLGLQWKTYYAGRRGAETEMNRFTNGNSQITSHHFGHSKEVADEHYIKPIPEETRKAALALDSALNSANKRQQETVSS